MQTLTASMPTLTKPTWRALVLPKEHGSWSLALEPVVLGLLAAPSLAGLAFGGAVVAAFFARRPLRIAFADAQLARRHAAARAVAVCGGIAAVLTAFAVVRAGVAWTAWLAPTLIGGLIFLRLDLRQAGRDSVAEVAGAAAFAWIPAVLAMIAGWTAPAAAALGIVMLARAVPTVLTVRDFLRARKAGTVGGVGPLLAANVAVAVLFALWRLGLAPALVVVFGLAFAVRTLVLLLRRRAGWRASALGIFECAMGIVFVVSIGLAWNP